MKDSLDWIDTDGGPFLLLAEDLLPDWRGTEGWTPESQGEDGSDYSRAGAVMDWLAPIPCGSGMAYVLGRDVGRVAWIASDRFTGGDLVQWIGIDDEALILPALHSDDCEALLAGADADRALLHVPAAGTLSLMQASEPGNDIRSRSTRLSLKPGSYEARWVCLDTPQVVMVVRRLSLLA